MFKNTKLNNKRSQQMNNKKDVVFEIITERIIEKLEAGVVPWHKPWTAGNAPKSLYTGKEYNGLNVWILVAEDYASPWWITAKQLKRIGGSVKDGEYKNSTIITWWNIGEYEAENKDTGEMETKKSFQLRYYRVYNIEQCDIPKAKLPEVPENVEEFNPIEAAQNVVNNMPSPPTIKHNGGEAYYSPLTDSITLPNPEEFDNPEAYYCTEFHELIHSTGHESRLNRKGITEVNRFGSKDYSQEELVAEMGAAFLCGTTGIVNTTIDNSASYLASWIKRLRGDSKLIVYAASKGQKGAEYILGSSSEK
jgi:antirestriction protein ArdC